MRPSWSSFSSVRRAISRRTPSKPDRITAPGVSSTMKSIPVSISSARMLRPSRADDPALQVVRLERARPTPSSRDACAPARRCMQVARMLRARRSASRRASSSIWWTSSALSWRSSSSSSFSRIWRACPEREVRDPLELAQLLALRRLELLGLGVEVAGAVLERALATGRPPRAGRRAPPPCVIRRSSMRAISARRSRSSASISSRSAVRVAGSAATMTGARPPPPSSVCPARSGARALGGMGIAPIPPAGCPAVRARPMRTATPPPTRPATMT